MAGSVGSLGDYLAQSGAAGAISDLPLIIPSPDPISLVADAIDLGLQIAGINPLAELESGFAGRPKSAATQQRGVAIENFGRRLHLSALASFGRAIAALPSRGVYLSSSAPTERRVIQQTWHRAFAALVQAGWPASRSVAQNLVRILYGAPGQDALDAHAEKFFRAGPAQPGMIQAEPPWYSPNSQVTNVPSTAIRTSEPPGILQSVLNAIGDSLYHNGMTAQDSADLIMSVARDAGEAAGAGAGVAIGTALAPWAPFAPQLLELIGAEVGNRFGQAAGSAFIDWLHSPQTSQPSATSPAAQPETSPATSTAVGQPVQAPYPNSPGYTPAQPSAPTIIETAPPTYTPAQSSETPPGCDCNCLQAMLADCSSKNIPVPVKLVWPDGQPVLISRKNPDGTMSKPYQPQIAPMDVTHPVELCLVCSGPDDLAAALAGQPNTCRIASITGESLSPGEVSTPISPAG